MKEVDMELADAESTLNVTAFMLKRKAGAFYELLASEFETKTLDVALADVIDQASRVQTALTKLMEAEKEADK